MKEIISTNEAFTLDGFFAEAETVEEVAMEVVPERMRKISSSTGIGVPFYRVECQISKRCA